MPTDQPTALSVADAKARFSELIERVGRGERFVISRRGKPALALVPPAEGLDGAVQAGRTPDDRGRPGRLG